MREISELIGPQQMDNLLEGLFPSELLVRRKITPFWTLPEKLVNFLKVFVYL